MTGSRTPPAEPAPPGPRAEAMPKGRQADSARHRQRVIAALNKATADGTGISVSSIARAAAVDRSFLYRHRDLLGKIHALEATPPATGDGAVPAVTRASLQADLLAAHEHAIRLTARARQLEKRLSETLGPVGSPRTARRRLDRLRSVAACEIRRGRPLRRGGEHSQLTAAAIRRWFRLRLVMSVARWPRRRRSRRSPAR
jgi:hypothetical protein